MNNQETAQYVVAGLLGAGAAKAQCKIVQSAKHELNVARGEISLLRTTFDTAVDLLGLTDHQKGTVALNKTDPDSLGAAAREAMNLARSAKPDPANDIAPYQPPREFENGPEQGDRDTMYHRLQEFLRYVRTTYPKTILEEINFDFTRTESVYANSNGVAWRANFGSYNFNIMFTSKDGPKTSSFNYAGCKFKDLDAPLEAIGGIDRLLAQSAAHMDPGVIPHKFSGPVIIAPECLSDFIGYFTRYISDYALITGNSVYKDKLHQKIAAAKLSLYAKPVAPEVAASYYFTGDGFLAQDGVIIENGVLNAFVLSLYAANKTGLPRTDHRGDCNVIAPGDTALDDMIAATPRGILLGRFSGGNPGDNGDFSGVAKNSFYIENGAIRHPLKETMISGNIVAMLQQIDQVSQERCNDGYRLLPWLKCNGITIAGK